MGNSVIVTSSAKEAAATTLGGRVRYVPIPSRRASHTETVDVAEPPSQEAIQQLRQRLREAD